MSLIILLIVIGGAVLMYSAIKDKNPIDVMKGAFKQ